MPTIEMLITLLFIFVVIVLPNLISASTSTCRKSKCKRNEPPVRFPFWLAERQATYCGYGHGFDLLCSSDKRTILTLPSSGEFIVNSIDYHDKLVWIDDPKSCFPKRLLDLDFSLVDSPFSYLYGIVNSTFLNCSSKTVIRSLPIPCLSNQYYNVIVIPSSWFYGDLNKATNSSQSPASLLHRCSVISTALLPISSPADPWDINVGVSLTWNLHKSRSCQGSSIRFENSTGLQIDSTGSANGAHSGISKALRYAIVIGFGIPALVCIIGVFFCAYKMNAFDRAHHHQPAVTELSTVVSQQPPIASTGPPTAIRMGLDGETIKSYPKTQLGESLELPNPNEKTCAICLCEYQHREIIRTIPQCKHYFHANCIDEWFKKDVTCPLCREQPDYKALGLPRQPQFS